MFENNLSEKKSAGGLEKDTNFRFDRGESYDLLGEYLQRLSVPKLLVR